MPATLRHELARKSIHLASAAVPITYAAGAPRTAVIAALALAGATAAAIEVARTRSPRVRTQFERLAGPLLRRHEYGHWSGATWMCAAYLGATLVFPRREAVAAMLAVAFGDAAAAVVGRLAAAHATTLATAHATAPARPARPARPAGAKTWSGSFACFAATALGAFLIARLPLAAALACGAAATLAERPRWRVDDNLRIALAAGAAAWGAAAWSAAWAARAV